jgi:NADPH-dependent curcumin reductase CurA
MPGVTAWYGLVKIIDAQSPARRWWSAPPPAPWVGSAFGALAKARGLRAVGIAGGPDKCKYAT